MNAVLHVLTAAEYDSAARTTRHENLAMKKLLLGLLISIAAPEFRAELQKALADIRHFSVS